MEDKRQNKNYQYHNKKKNRNRSNYYKKNQQRNSSNNIDRIEKKSEEKVKEVVKSEAPRKKRHPFVNFFLFLTLLSSLAFFGISLWKGQDSTNFFQGFVSSVILVIFSILFIGICVGSNSRKKGTIFLGSIFLLLFNLFGSLTSLGFVTIPAIGQTENFVGKSLTEVVNWASKNEITINQDYEYSDMVPEYSIVSQDIPEGSKIKDLKEITVAVSEGPNPDKEIIIPEMNGWDTERVIDYVEDNYLNNVSVSFRESISPENTVIEQSDSGSMKRSSKLELTFSLGEEASKDDVKLVDLTNKSQFAAEVYLKQNQIKYKIKKGFSNKIEPGNVAKQSIKPNTMVKVNDDDEKLVVTISKGKSIKVPNLKDMSMVEITNWVIENKLKVEFSNRYDDSVKENHVISANYDKGDKVEQGETIKVVISRGKLVMEKFKSYDDFKTWANKYGISYEEKREFSEDVPQGEVISYSYKKGETIKNGDVIVVTISDGIEVKVPDLEGMTKKEAINALEEVGLKYNFVTRSSSKEKNTVIDQSISAGSKVSEETTITVTLSSGKKVSHREESDNDSNDSGNSSKPGSSGNSSSKPSKPESDSKPEPVCHSCPDIRGGQLKSIVLAESGSFDDAAEAVRTFIQSKCSGVTVVVKGDTSSGFAPGSWITGWGGGSLNSCDTIEITLAK